MTRKPHEKPRSLVSGAHAEPLSVTLLDADGRVMPYQLSQDDADTWYTVFRSTFGPKQALVDELRAETGAYTVIVHFDDCEMTFSAKGTSVEYPV